MSIRARVVARARAATSGLSARDRKFLLPAIAAVVVAAIVWFVSFRPPAVQSAAGEPVLVSALVKTEMPRQQTIGTTLTAFGQAMPGLDVAITFPHAGQVSRLLVIPSQRVPRGTSLVTLTSDPTARLAYIQAQTAVNFAQSELKRNQELFALQLATQSQVDAARRALQDAQAALSTQRQLGGASGTSTVTAPFDGVVDSVHVSQGDRVQPGAVIMQLGHIDTLRVRLGIEPSDSRLVRVGARAMLSVLDDSSKTVAVTIAESQGVVDPRTQLIDAVAMVPASRAPFLVPGMHVRTTIQVGQQSTWTVPRNAVLADSAGSYLFQVASGKARRVNVAPAAETDALTAVTGPIDPRLPIVILGNYELKDGMAVREASGARTK